MTCEDLVSELNPCVVHGQVEAAIKASGLPKTARRPTHLDLGKSSTAAAAPQPVKEGGVVKMGRREAWARFLAYEVRCCGVPGGEPGTCGDTGGGAVWRALCSCARRHLAPCSTDG